MFQGIWDGFKNKDSIASAYQLNISDLDDIEILIAKYHTGDYEGSLFVLIRRNDKLYEVNASHCSCYGLEGQWDPEETSLEALKKRNDQFVSTNEMLIIESYLSGGASMEPTMIRIVRDDNGDMVFAVKDNKVPKPFKLKNSVEMQLFDSVEHRQAYLDAKDHQNLKASALAKLSAAERIALGLVDQ